MTTARARIATAIASGLLLAASFPRFDQGYLAWVALVPLLVVIRGLAPRKAAGYGWITGFVFFLVTIYWIPDTISNFTSISPALAKALLLLMAGAAAYSHALFAFGVEALAAAGWSRVLVAPALWVVLEWMRCFVVAEFPWNLLGYSQMRTVTMAQAADLGGVYLLSFVLVLASAFVAEAWTARRHGGRVTAKLAAAVALPMLLFVYGSVRLAGLDATPYAGSLRVAIAQGDIAQDQKWDATLRDRIFSRYLDLTEKAADAGAELVVWPEAALPFYIRRDMGTLDLVRVARERGIDLLVGAPGLEDRDGQGLKDYNQAWLVRASGDFEGPYDKIQLVPFGEYIPLFGLFGMVDIAVESVGQLGRGSELTIFETKPLSPPIPPAGAAPDRAGDPPPAAAAATPAAAPHSAAGRAARFATLICYEGIFPELTRSFAAEGADFLVNISNDAWYGDTSAPDQHLAMSAMRAIENRLPLVRSTNTGISAFVTDEGRIGPTTPLFQEDMLVETVLVRDVWSFYRVYGDVFLHLCQALVAIGVTTALLRRRRSARQDHPVESASH